MTPTRARFAPTGASRRSRPARRSTARCRSGLGLLAMALLAGACSGRQLTVRPDPPPGPGTWAAVTVAAVSAAVVLGLLATLPAWRDHHRRRWLAMVLGAQTGALLVTAAVVTGAALRSRQLTQRSPTELPDVALLELSAIGDSRFADLILVGAVLFLLLPALITGLTAHLATRSTTGERWMACVVLALQAGAGLLAVGLLISGDRGLVPWLVAANGPVAACGVVACWPARPPVPHRDGPAGAGRVPAGAR